MDTEQNGIVRQKGTKLDTDRRFISWLLFAGLLLLYASTLTRQYYWDGIDFAQAIEDAPGLSAALFHPNHLIYNLFGYIVYHAFLAAGAHVRALTALQLTNCALAALTVLLFFRILLTCFNSLYLSLCLALLCACSATWWRFATDADSYVVSVGLLLLCFRFLLPGRKPRPLSAALSHIAAILFHQLAVFFAPVVLLGLWQQTAGQPRRARLLVLVEYTITAGGLTAIAYVAAFRLLTKSFALPAFVRWLTNYSSEHGFSFAPWADLVFSARGHVRLFVEGRLSLLAGLMTPWLIALMALLAITALFLTYQSLRTGRELIGLWRAHGPHAPALSALRQLCWVWVLPYVAFLFFFIPQNTFYRLFYLPALLLLLGSWLAPVEARPAHRHRYRLAALVATLALSNLLFVIYPYTQVRNNPPLALALALRQSWPPNTIIFIGSSNTDNRLCRYFNQGTIWRELDAQSVSDIAQEVRGAQGSGAPVWLEITAVDRVRSLPGGVDWLATYTTSTAHMELINSKYRLQFLRLNPVP